MDLIIKDEEVREINIADIVSNRDKGIVIIKGEKQGKWEERNSDLVKEITALDALEIGASKAALINGVPQSSASKYSDGKDIADDDTRARVLSKKYDIANTATTKLMEALNLLDPGNIEKEIDRFKAAGIMANIVEKVTSNGKNGNQEVHLHLYAPKQKSLDAFEIIDVN